MHRLLVLIAIVLFSLGSLSGPGMGSALASGSFLAAPDHEFGEAPGAIAEDVSVKPCPKQIKGQGVFCSQSVAIMPPAETCLLALSGAAYELGFTGGAPWPVDSRHFRPPQSA